jgi:general secretion pathway protein D
MVGCGRSYWDPTIKVEESKGHESVVGAVGTTASGASTQGLGIDDSVSLGDDKSKAVDSVKKGSGNFVRRVAGPSVDTTPGDVTLNFDGTDIREVVKVILGDLLQVNYVLSPAVQGTASLQTGRPLRREHLIPTLETLLRMNSAAIVYKSGTYEIIPIANAVQGNLVPQLGESTRALPEGYSIQVVPLRYVGADEMNRILQPLAPEGSIIRVDNMRNLLVIAGTSPEMGNLIDTIKMFDVDWMKGLSVGFFVLDYAKAKDVATQLEGLMADDTGSPMKGLFHFLPVESSNSLMVITPQESYLQQARNWIERLDTAAASGSAAARLYVYRVKHGKAENLAEVLSQAFGASKEKKQSVGGTAPGLGTSSIGAQAVIGQMGTGMGSGSGIGTGMGSGSGMGSGLGSGTGSGFGQGGMSDGQGLSGGSGSGGVSVQARTFELDSEEVSVVADVMNNSILVRASPRNYKKILDALKQLDIVPLQVLVQASIIEITLTGTLEYGISWNFLANLGDSGYKSDFSLNGLTNQKYTGQTNTITDTTTGTAIGTTTGTTTGTVASTAAAAATAGTDLLHRTFPGFNWTIVANPSRLVANLSALAEQTKVNVLSSPSVMVLDNQNATILVGKEVPVQTTAQQSTIANSNIINSYQYKQAGVSLEVKPRVTPGGMVQMAIYQKVDTVIDETLDRPKFQNRRVKSTVAVRSNQAVVLGGLIQDKLDESKGGVPGFYELPYIGPLFGKTGKKAERTELIVILIPKVIASDQDVESVSQDFRNRLRGMELKF